MTLLLSSSKVYFGWYSNLSQETLSDSCYTSLSQTSGPQKSPPPRAFLSILLLASHALSLLKNSLLINFFWLLQPYVLHRSLLSGYHNSLSFLKPSISYKLSSLKIGFRSISVQDKQQAYSLFLRIFFKIPSESLSLQTRERTTSCLLTVIHWVNVDELSAHVLLTVTGVHDYD